MKLKLDENLSNLKVVLASLGHDATTAAEEGLLSQPDTAVERAAYSEGRMSYEPTSSRGAKIADFSIEYCRFTAEIS